MATASQPDFSEYEYNIAFDNENGLQQSQEYFFATIGDRREKLRVQDYAAIYRHPFLYETLLWDLLGCRSPHLLADLLSDLARAGRLPKNRWRAFEIGAGSGAFGQLIKERFKPELLVGLDLLPEAKQAAERDRPKLYDRYLVADLVKPGGGVRAYLESCRFNFAGAVAAGGDNHIPVAAYETTFSLLERGGVFLFHVRPNQKDRMSTQLCEWVDGKIAGKALTPLFDGPVFHRKAVDGRDIHYRVVVGAKA